MLRTIIFDIDGTLWHTGASYVYAYHKVCDFYGVEKRKSDDEIKACLGIKIEEVLKRLFPDLEGKENLGQQAMNFSIEYLMAHKDECCFEGVSQLLMKLSETFDVYLVSNCPRDYANAFVKISETAEYIKAVYTIEDGEKEENIKRIADLSQGKLLLVGDSTDDYNALSDRYTQYFCYAKYGYKLCESYDYSIEFPLELLDVVKRITVKERQSGGTPYRVLSKGDNQITLINKDENTSYFGFVKYKDEGFEDVVKELKSVCNTRLIGPIDFNTYYPYRFALDCYDLELFPDLSGEKELPYFLKNGFGYHQEYVSILTEADYGACERLKKAKLSSEYSIKEFHSDEVYSHLDDIYEVATSAFENAYLHEPIERQDFIDIYVEALRGITPDVIIIYRNESPIAFSFCYEDPLKRFYVSKTIAIKKKERNSKVILALMYHSLEMMKQKNHNIVLNHFKMRAATRAFNLCSKRTIAKKRYTLLEYECEK